MPTIAAMMGLTSYTPYKEAISAIVWVFGPCLLNKISLKPTSTVSRTDRIRENFFGIRTQFLKFTQTNTLTKYTWAFLKNVPIGMTSSTLFVLLFYHLLDPKPAYQFQICKYALSGIISLLITEQDQGIKPRCSNRRDFFPKKPYLGNPLRQFSQPGPRRHKSEPPRKDISGPQPGSASKSIPNLRDPTTLAGKFLE